jgi:hypothetical protein
MMLGWLLAIALTCPGSSPAVVLKSFQTASEAPSQTQRSTTVVSPQADTQRTHGVAGLRARALQTDEIEQSLSRARRDMGIGRIFQSQGNVVGPVMADVQNLASRYGFVYISDIRVDLNFENKPVCEALREVAERSKHQLRLDKDMPTTVRVTLSVPNVKLSTALDLITQAADVKWGREVRLLKEAKQAKNSLVIGRNVIPTTVIAMYEDEESSKPEWTINTSGLSESILAMAAPLSPKWVMTTTEDRASFTCPHCRNQVTTIVQRGQPRCPKCTSVFQSDWKFCPSDGAKRPYLNKPWKFCPHCGKGIEFEQVGEAASLINTLLGPGSRLAVNISAEGCKDREKKSLGALAGIFPVAGDGTIQMKWIGRVNVSGLTAAEAAKSISTLLKPYVKTPVVIKGEFVPPTMGEPDTPMN